MDTNSCLKNKMAGGVSGPLPVGMARPCGCYPSARPLVFHPVQHCCSSCCHRSQLQCDLHPRVPTHCLPRALPAGMGWWGDGLVREWRESSRMFDSFRTVSRGTFSRWKKWVTGRRPFYTSCVLPLLPDCRGSDQLSPAPSTRPSPPRWTISSNP